MFEIYCSRIRHEHYESYSSYLYTKRSYQKKTHFENYCAQHLCKFYCAIALESLFSPLVIPHANSEPCFSVHFSQRDFLSPGAVRSKFDTSSSCFLLLFAFLEDFFFDILPFLQINYLFLFFYYIFC